MTACGESAKARNKRTRRWFLLIPLLPALGWLSVALAMAALIALFCKYNESLQWIVQAAGCCLHVVPFVLIKIALVYTIYHTEIWFARLSIDFVGNRNLLDERAAKRKAFALYLRNHTLEADALVVGFPVTSGDATGARGTGLGFWPIPRNLGEHQVLEQLSRAMPVFVVDWPHDKKIGFAPRVLVDRSNWFDEVSRLIPHAKVVVVRYAGGTDGILQELRHLATLPRRPKTILFTSQAGRSELEKEIPPLFDESLTVVVDAGFPEGQLKRLFESMC